MAQVVALGAAGQTLDIEFKAGGQTAGADDLLGVTPSVAGANTWVFRDAPVSTDWRGVTLTTKNEDNGAELLRPLVPKIIRETYLITAVDGNRVSASGMTDATYTENMFVGGTASLNKVENGVLSEIRNADVIGGNWGVRHSIGAVSTPGFNYRFQNWNGVGVRYWVGVAAVVAGEIGPVSYVPYDMPETVAGDAAVNANAATIVWADGGAAVAPESVAVVADASGAQTVNVT